MQWVDGNTRSFIAGAAIARFLRVTLSSGKLAAAGATTKELGVLRDAAFADGDVRAVILRNKEGTIPMIANAALAVGAAVWTAASGKVGAASTGAFLIGTAVTASTADGDQIEVLPNTHGDTASP